MKIPAWLVVVLGGSAPLATGRRTEGQGAARAKSREGGWFGKRK